MVVLEKVYEEISFRHCLTICNIAQEPRELQRFIAPADSSAGLLK